MQVETLVLGMLATNCYILFDDGDGRAAVIDPPGEIKKIISTLHRLDLECVAILCTHGHVDHVAGAGPLSDATDAPVIIHPMDADALASPRTRLVGLMGGMMSARPRQVLTVEDGDEIEVGTLKLKAMHTPGHTRGSMSFYLPGALFCGDLIFQGSIGRTDLRGGSLQMLLESARRKVWPLPDETVIYPGHGPVTTLGVEKKSNPFLMGLD